MRTDLYIGQTMPIAALLVSALLGSQVAAGEAEHAAAARREQGGSLEDSDRKLRENSTSHTTEALSQGARLCGSAVIGVKTLINLTSDDADASEEAMAQSAGLNTSQIPMTTRVVPTPVERSRCS